MALAEVGRVEAYRVGALPTAAAVVAGALAAVGAFYLVVGALILANPGT